MRVAYVIASYGTPRLAEKARASILQYRPYAPVVIVEAQRPAKAGGDLGYSAALNAGRMRLRALPRQPDVLCFLNADVEMLEDDTPVLDLLADPEVAIVGPRQLDAEDRIAHGGIVAHEDGTEWDLELRHRCWLWPLADADELTRPTMAAPTVPGSVFYVRTAVLDALGGWPTWTRFYYEDTWLCFLARHRGHEVLYTGKVSWRHFGEASPVSKAWRESAMAEARRRFVDRCRVEGVPLRVWPDEDVREFRARLVAGGS